MNSSFFAANRERLIEALGGEALVVLTAYHEMQRSNDAAWAFEQEANFWYLSGVPAPDWRLIIDGKRGRTYAVSPSVSDTKQIFDGSLSPEAALVLSGADEVIGREQASALLAELARTHKVAYSPNESDYLSKYAEFTFNPAQQELAVELKEMFAEIKNCHQQLAALRTIKQDSEIGLIQHAIDISIAGYQEMKLELDNYHHEYEAEARLSYEFRRGGSDGHAYDPIVAAGRNACTLHYNANRAQMSKRSLLLVDAGARYEGYCADITRTYALGQPTKRMQHIHQVVQHVQAEVIRACRPGLALEQLQALTDSLMREALGSLDLGTDEAALRRYFPHAISHGLGIDVHDRLAGYDELQPGMVLTVEPGIYIADEGIGVRIEDDILITDNGARNLSGALSTDL